METQQRTEAAAEQMVDRDLSEQIKKATKESHVRSESTALMQSFLKGTVSLEQYKLLLCSLYKVYQTLEEELDRNCEHPSVAPIYFPAELARLESIEKDLEFFYGDRWRDRVVVPAATHRYCHRLRQIGQDNPEFLLAHSYTRYLGDLSGGQILGRIARKSMGLKHNEGLSFFAFLGVSSPTLFKQLYRAGMNSVELTEEERSGVLDEAVRAFELNIQMFDGLQELESITENQLQSSSPSLPKPAPSLQLPGFSMGLSPLLRMALGLFLLLATISVGVYAF